MRSKGHLDLGLGLLGLLGQEDSLDVGEDTTLGDGHTGEQLVELLIVADGQLEVAGDDPGTHSHICCLLNSLNHFHVDTDSEAAGGLWVHRLWCYEYAEH